MMTRNIATTMKMLLCFNLTITLATAFFFDLEKESKPQMSDGDIHNIACVQRWRLEATCMVGLWLQCLPDSSSDRVRAEARGYKTFPVEGGEIHLKRYNVTRTLDKALKICRSDGATLVKIDTKEKDDIVRGLFHYKDYKKAINPWIGLRDTTRSNIYRWTDGSDLTYTNWHDGEPNFKFHGRDEDCVHLHLFIINSKWNDIACYRLKAFICEI